MATKKDKNFRIVSENFFNAASETAEKTLELVYKAYLSTSLFNLQLPRGDKRTSTVRFNFYPELDPLTEKEQSVEMPLGGINPKSSH